MNRYTSRSLFLTSALCLVMGVTLVHGSGTVASAASVPPRHDMSHPTLMTGTFGSSGLAGTRQIKPQYNALGSCYNNVGYPQTEQDGRNTWTVSKGDLMGWVQYWWCPTYYGDPNGLNFTYGRTYVTSGHEYVQVGNQQTQIAGGAFLESPSQSVWYDQENAHGWTVYASSAPNNYVYDYSYPQSGAPGDTYKAAMIALAPYEYLSFITYSYDFQ